MTPADAMLRDQLIDRRRRLETAQANGYQASNVQDLLQNIDRALTEMEQGSYGLCRVCHESIETERLLANPLAQVCLSHLTTGEQRDLEADLQLAAQIQRELLPKSDLRHAGWRTAHHYQPAGLVSGDYCDFLTTASDHLCFMLGDVSGKGVAASMLMGQLHAMLRTLFSLGLPLTQVVERASRSFCESTLPTHFATLICGRAHQSGAVEFCNAGHLPPLLVRQNTVTPLESAGLPIGLFCSEQFTQQTIQLAPGDSLVLFTDGLTEAEDEDGCDFGKDRVIRLVEKNRTSDPDEMVRALLKDLTSFRRTTPQGDDLTLMVIQRTE